MSPRGLLTLRCGTERRWCPAFESVCTNETQTCAPFSLFPLTAIHGQVGKQCLQCLNHVLLTILFLKMLSISQTGSIGSNHKKRSLCQLSSLKTLGRHVSSVMAGSKGSRDLVSVPLSPPLGSALHGDSAVMNAASFWEVEKLAVSSCHHPQYFISFPERREAGGREQAPFFQNSDKSRQELPLAQPGCVRETRVAWRRRGFPGENQGAVTERRGSRDWTSQK